MDAKSFLIPAGLFLLVALVAGYCYQQNKQLTDLLVQNSQKQEQSVAQLTGELKGLADRFALQKAGWDGQVSTWQSLEQENSQLRELLPQIKASIVEIKSVIAQSRTEAWKIKDDTQQWQKDYVSTLVEIEKKVNALGEEVVSLSEVVDQGLPKILQEVDAMKSDIDKIKKSADAKPAVPAYQPLPRFDPDWKE